MKSNLKSSSFFRGRASAASQAMSGSGSSSPTFLLSIPLGRTDYKTGVALIQTPSTVTGALQQRTIASLYFTDVLSDAVSQAMVRSSLTFTGYNGDAATTLVDWRLSAYFYDVDSKLSDAAFGDSDTQEFIQISSAQINGSNLEIIFNNTSAGSQVFTAHVEYRVQKGIAV